jgi:hypothetical protein
LLGGGGGSGPLAGGVAGAAGAAGRSLSSGVIGQLFFDTVEINDYPQTAKWRVTQKGALDHITEETDTAIAAKGVYVPPGRNPLPGEVKLHLRIEGRDETSVALAKAEIRRMLEEAAASARPEEPRYTRYALL